MQKTALFALSVYATATAGIPAPQYGMNGGGYGYPMMGNAGPMMGNAGPMAGPYGMYGPYGGGNGPMYMPGSGGAGRYYNSNMRGQRYHAHASADEWPLPKNPYKNARQNRYFANNAMYMDGMGSPMMHASGHNRVPQNDDDSDSEDSEQKESSSASPNSGDSDGTNDTHVGGVNRVSASAASDAIHTSELLLEHSLMADPNTSLDLAMLSNKIINVNAFASSSSSGGAAQTHEAPASATKSHSPAKARQTITRNISSSKPTPGISAPKANREPKESPRGKPVVRASSLKIDPSSTTASFRSKIRATAASVAEPHTPTTTNHDGHLQTAHTSPAASKTSSEPSMKRIRGL
ncbi:hypothetical protein EV175_002583 [Coemansia sp. RSA 1933]|nr:hypothetical protein EV175_002583 [Coemansia sp. RSA 1933]